MDVSWRDKWTNERLCLTSEKDEVGWSKGAFVFLFSSQIHTRTTERQNDTHKYEIIGVD